MTTTSATTQLPTITPPVPKDFEGAGHMGDVLWTDMAGTCVHPDPAGPSGERWTYAGSDIDVAIEFAKAKSKATPIPTAFGEPDARFATQGQAIAQAKDGTYWIAGLVSGSDLEHRHPVAVDGIAIESVTGYGSGNEVPFEIRPANGSPTLDIKYVVGANRISTAVLGETQEPVAPHVERTSTPAPARDFAAAPTAWEVDDVGKLTWRMYRPGSGVPANITKRVDIDRSTMVAAGPTFDDAIDTAYDLLEERPARNGMGEPFSQFGKQAHAILQAADGNYVLAGLTDAAGTDASSIAIDGLVMRGVASVAFAPASNDAALAIRGIIGNNTLLDFRPTAQGNETISSQSSRPSGVVDPLTPRTS
jgi:hypothetical protein